MTNTIFHNISTRTLNIIEATIMDRLNNYEKQELENEIMKRIRKIIKNREEKNENKRN